MGWSLADVETVTVHGRSAEQIIPYFAPGNRLLVLTRDGNSPKEVATLLKANGYGESRMSVLAALGGPREKRLDGIAKTCGAKYLIFIRLPSNALRDLMPGYCRVPASRMTFLSMMAK